MQVTSTKITPPELARRYGCKPSKVIAWIVSGELRAINLAARTDTRPRWMIDESDIAIFEERRASQPPIPQTPQRRNPALPDGFVRYF